MAHSFSDGASITIIIFASRGPSDLILICGGAAGPGVALGEEPGRDRDETSESSEGFEDVMFGRCVDGDGDGAVDEEVVGFGG